MGGVNSCCIPRYQNPNKCRENHSSTPKVKGHRRNLSAAFNLADMEKEEPVVELLNVNMASEEELMTLPGINRQTAKNIVEYRRQIEGFKKVEDLALVSGVGATKLSIIRGEISVGRKKTSQSSSQSSSLKDLSLQDTSSRSSAKSHKVSLSFPKVNINTSNVFQLMKVKGVSQLLAESIVAYRDKKGQFSSLDDLIKVKGINQAVLSALRPHFVLTDDNAQLGLPPQQAATQPSLPTYLASHQRNHSYTNGIVPCIGDAPVVLANHLGSQDDLLNMYGPISRKSMRRKKNPVQLQKDNRPVVRVASWNLQGFSSEKAENPGVKEVICMSVLENGFSIVAVQDLQDKEALQKICEELNKPTIPNVKKWLGRRGTWQSVTSSQKDGSLVGYLYDSGIGLQFMKKLDLPMKLSDKCPLPLLAVFKKDQCECLFCNIHITDEVSASSDVSTFCEVVKQKAKDWLIESMVVLGDMGSAAKNPDFNSKMESSGFSCILNSCKVEGGDSKLKKSDQIWMDLSSQSTAFSGQKGLVTDGLTSPWIPDGWKWGGYATDHAPIWLELYADYVQNNPETPVTVTENGLQMLRMAMPLVQIAES